MTNHIITGKQTQAIFFLFWAGSIVVMGINPEAKQDSWISIVVAGIMLLPLIALYVRITHLYPGLNLFEISLKIFGNIGGQALSLLFALYAIHLGSMVTNTFTKFIKIINMPETPEFLSATFIVLICMWSVRNGPENIGRMSKFIWAPVVITSFITVLISLKDMDLNNLKPIMETDFKSLISGAYTYFMLPFGEMVLCLSFFSAVSTKASSSKIMIKSLVAVLLFFIMVTLRNILTLGVPTALRYYFPSNASVSIISAGGFFTRIEVLIGIDLLLTGFIKICVCLYAASLGLAKALNISDQKAIVAPCGLLIITLAGLLNRNSVLMIQFIPYYRIYAIPFEIILPIILWIGAEIQTKIKTAGIGSTENM